MVGVAGFEPAASWSRTKRDTKLRHTPMQTATYYSDSQFGCQDVSNGCGEVISKNEAPGFA